MSETKRFIAFFLFLQFVLSGVGQTAPAKTTKKPKSIWDIPRGTRNEIFLWPHRSTVYFVTKERKIKYDTNYVKSNYKKIVVTLPIATRFLQFTLKDEQSDKKLVFTPNLHYTIGISISSRWASFIINSGIKVYSGNPDITGKTKFNDIQLNIYGRKVTTDMYFQNYTGFYIKNSRSFSAYTSERPYAIRSDVNALHLGVSSYYALNNKKFSTGSSFAFVEQQKKSAGSILLGTYYSYLKASSDSSLVSAPFRAEFDTLSLYKSGQTHDFGLNIGYIYTLVIRKKMQVTASAVQGVGGKYLSFRHEDGSNTNKITGGAGKLHLRVALKYDTGKYFISAIGLYDYLLLTGLSSATFDYSFGKIMLCTGYRFSVIREEKKLLRRLKLIDY